MSNQFSDAELEAFLDESLAPNLAAEVEKMAREDGETLERLAAINRARDAGVHTIGSIWRRYQVGIPTSEEMGQFLLGILDSEHAKYINFRLKTIKCPFTLALKRDLEESQNNETATKNRLHRDTIYKSSAGLLGGKNPPKE